MNRLSMMDFSLLALESEESPKHLAALQLFQVPRTYKGDFAGEVLAAYRSSEIAHPFDKKLHFPRVGLPEWVDAPDLDIDYHLTRLAVPRPGDMGALMRLVARLNIPLLDRKRPLWEYYIIDGLPHGAVATFFKVHHACVDGMLASMRMQASLTHSAQDKKILPFWAPLPGLPGRPAGKPSESSTGALSLIRLAPELLRKLPNYAGSVISVGKTMLFPSEDDIKVPLTPFNGPVNASRSVAFQTLPLAPIKQIGKLSGATVNDVVLACVDGSVNSYLRSRDNLPDVPLVAASPISVRSEKGGSGSNEVALMQVALGAPGADPKTRLEQVRDAATQAKSDLSAQPPEALKLGTVLGAAITAVMDQLQLTDRFPQANILVSNVVGAKTPLYLNGARLTGSFALPVLVPGLAINFTLITREDNLDFGITACRDMVPDLQELSDGMIRFFESLEQAFGLKTPVRPKPRPEPGRGARRKTRPGRKSTRAARGEQRQ